MRARPARFAKSVTFPRRRANTQLETKQMENLTRRSLVRTCSAMFSIGCFRLVADARNQGTEVSVIRFGRAGMMARP
jgi:hypothetical protein